ncbi:uncharacterized protein [Littorina saxatilis]|uniref:uncharacterized protein n=1 Tax=Littorina saxatilis TaxID=31220 RepID=UPI0038B4E186
MLHLAPGENAVLELRTRSYAKKNLTCTLSHLASSVLPSKQDQRTCDGNIHVSGSPPDVLVSLSFFNVSYNDHGTWRLSLSNDVKGTDHVNFTLNVVSASAEAGSVIVVLWVVAGHAVVIILVMVVVIACKKG